MDNRVAYEAGQDDIRLLRERISALESENRSLRHELAARQHEQDAWLHLYNLLMQTPAAVCVLRGPEHVFELANPFYHALTGKASVVGRTVREVFPELEGQAIFELLDQVYTTGVPFVAQERPLRWDRFGTGRLEESWLNFAYQPMRAHDGSIIGIFVHATDVTEQVQARQKLEEHTAALDRLNAELHTRVHELHESRELLQSIVDAWPAAISVQDSHGHYLLINRWVEEHIGSSRAHIVGRTDAEVFPTGRPLPGHAPYQQVLASGQPIEQESSLMQADGLHTYLSLTFPMQDQQQHIWAICNVATDITERKRMEEMLRLQSRLLDSVGQAVIVTQPDGTITYWNRAAETMYGWTAQEVLGQSVMLITVPEPSYNIGHEIMERLRTGEVWTGEFLTRRRDGTLMPILVTDVPFTDESGNLAGIIGVSLDISERKKMEEALRENQRLIQGIIDHSPVMLFVKDLEGRILLINRRAAADLGHTPEELVGRYDAEFVPPEMAAIYHANDQQVLASGQPQTVEEDVVYTDGLHTVMSVKFPILDDQGQIVAIGGISTDISERKQMEQALLQSEERFRRLVENNLVGIGVANEESVLYANEAYLRILGYAGKDDTPQQVDWWAVTPPEYHHLDARGVEEIKLHGTCTPFEKEYLRKDGSRVPVLLGGELLEQSPLSWVVFVLDMTERKQIEAALQRANDRLMLAIEALDGFIYDWDLETGTVERSSGLPKVLGYLPEEMPESPSWWRDRIHPDDRDDTIRLRDDVLARADSYAAEYRVLHRDGYYVYVWDRGIIVRDADGHAKRVVGCSINITERKQQEQERAELLAREQQARQQAERVAEQNARLHAVTAALTQALTPEQVISIMLEQGVTSTGAYAAAVVLLPDSDRIPLAEQTIAYVAQSRGYPQEMMEKWRTISLEQDTPLSKAIRSGEAIWIESREHLAAQFPELSPTPSSVAWMSIPLWVGERVYGAVGMSFSEARAFAAQERAFILTMMEQCAQSLERARLYQQVQQSWHLAETQRERLERLYHATAALSTTITQEQVGDVVLRMGLEAANAQGGALMVLPQRDSTLELVNAVGLPLDDEQDSQRLPLHLSYPMADAIRTGHPVVLESSAAWQQQYPAIVDATSTAYLESIVVLPIHGDAGIFGAISFHFEQPQSISQEDLDFFTTLARQCGQALERARLYEAECQSRNMAEAAVSQRNHMLSIIAHDLRTPLTVLQATTQMLQRQLSNLNNLDEARIERSLKRLHMAAAQMTGQMQELDDIAHLHSEQPLPLNYTQFDLVAMINQAIQICQNATTQHQIRFESACPTLLIEADEPRLTRICNNLLQNAVKYSPGGGEVVVTLSRIEQHGQPFVELTVRDQGMGIPAEDLSIIFEPFHRGSNAENRIPGTGLGLASVRSIVERHNGTISVASQVGQGSIFTVQLPLIQPAAISDLL